VLAVQDWESCPLALVVPVIVVKPPKEPLAPLEGAVKVTLTPEIGLPKASVTVQVT